MRKCHNNFEIPVELQGEDVYDMLYIFENEDEAVKYVVENYNISEGKLLEELHEDDRWREEFGKETYPRVATVKGCTSISELMSGEYILWVAY